MTVETVSERKTREAARRAAAAVMAEMRAFVRDHGGRFLVFGSAAAGAMRHDSDLDVIVDMPKSLSEPANRLVEDAAHRHRVPLDLHEWRFASERLRARVLASAVVIEGHAAYQQVDSPDM
jgi:predicted nucleotidyltransferase